MKKINKFWKQPFLFLFICLPLWRREHLSKQALSKTPLEYTNEMRNIWVSIIVNMIISGVFLNKPFLRPPGARQWNGEYWSNDNWEHNYFGRYTKQALFEIPHRTSQWNEEYLSIYNCKHNYSGRFSKQALSETPLEHANEMGNIWVMIMGGGNLIMTLFHPRQ